MAEVCVSRNMSITAGVLGIEAWAIPRVVHDATYNSTGDGNFTTAKTVLPGQLMIDSSIQSWTNTAPLDAMVLLRFQRARRDWFTPNPNAIQIRDRYTYTLNGDDPRVPDTSSTYHGQSGGAGDIGANSTATPYEGVFYEYEDGTMLEDWIKVPPAATLKFWYRCYMWTPPPWSNNANNNNPTAGCNVRSIRVIAMAFPTQDTEVLP